eukprot:31396-Pelagococcus_subviridis.AAC.3
MRRNASLAARSHTFFCCRYQCASIPLGRSHVIVCPCGGRRSSSFTSSRPFLHITRRRSRASCAFATRDFASCGVCTHLRHHVASASGDGAPRKENNPRRSSNPRDAGVPLTAHRCVATSCLAIAAAAAVLLSTSCASSNTTLHHVKRVSGVGTIEYRFAYLDARAAPAASPLGS